MEAILMILFIVISLYVINHFDPLLIKLLPIFLFIVLFHTIRGIEEWKVRKKEKAYYHEWLVSISMLVMLLFITMQEFFG